MRKLVEYPKDTISDSLLKKLQKYVDNPDFDPVVIEKVSKACKSLCMWVRALEMYARVYRNVEPKRRRLVTPYIFPFSVSSSSTFPFYFTACF